MKTLNSILDFLHNDSIASNLVAGIIEFTAGVIYGKHALRAHLGPIHTLLDEKRKLIDEMHELLHHVHKDKAEELNNK